MNPTAAAAIYVGGFFAVLVGGAAAAAIEYRNDQSARALDLVLIAVALAAFWPLTVPGVVLAMVVRAFYWERP